MQPRPKGTGSSSRLAALAQPKRSVATRTTPSSTSRELGRMSNPTSTRGREISGAIDNMMDEYYGLEGNGDGVRGGTTSAPIATSATDKASLRGAVSFDSPYARLSGVTVRITNRQWMGGPIDTEGRVFDASDRNLLCMDVQENQAVVGSADHGLVVFDINTCKKKRELYSKRFGHTEWVTSCCFLPSGQILSGGMDSKLCLWDRSAVRCSDLLGHTGSISQVACNEGGIAVSAGYDRTLRLWDCNGGGMSVGTLQGHNQPVMQFSWYGGTLMSGDRRGTIRVWDLERQKCAASFETKHGQISSLGHLLNDEGQLSACGDQGGCVSIFDFARTGATPIFQEVLHRGGAVTEIKGMAATNMLITGGADKKIHCLDPRMNFQPVHTFTDHQDFIYSMETFGPLVLSGAGNGWLLVHDATTGECLYGLGANAAAVRNIFPTQEKLICAGDDGKAMVYDF